MILALVWGCAGDAEDSAGAEDAAAEPCADVPRESWENFGAGFTLHQCESCHGSTAVERNGAPETIAFDTVAQVWALQERVLARAASEPPSMPPMGGTSKDDRVRLRWWLECGEPGS